MKSGLIGIGPWGRNYIKTIEKIPEIDLGWVCSPHRRYDEELPEFCKFTNNFEDILKDFETKAIIISTPPHTHYELTKKALLAGKDVLVEKPMTLSSKDALELVELSKKLSRILMVGHIYLYNPATNELKRMIEKNEFGKIYHFYSNRSNCSPGRTDINVMWDLLPHDISLMNYLTGKTPVSVNVVGKKILGSDIEKVVNIFLEYPDGLVGSVYASYTEPEKTRKINIMGDRKNVVFDDLLKNKLKIYSSKNPNEFYSPELDNRSPLEIQCTHFYECIKNKREPLSRGGEGYEVVKILEYLQKALETGQEIKVTL